MSDKTVKNVITPNDLFIRGIFSRTKAYYLDIYQREYKWQKSNVETLLNDIEVRFNLHSRDKMKPTEIQADVLEHFEPYYLNTFLTHSSSTAASIVDGQQRLTTILLILIKLYKMLSRIEEESQFRGKTFASSTLEAMIFERDDFGSATRFKIYNPNREETFRAIIENREIKTADVADETPNRIVENYKFINSYYDELFRSTEKDLPYDIVKLTYYICYLLDRISIVEIKIEQQKNVAMIFEVVNDRGLGLKPYEILKGKLIGNLPSEQKEHANKIWTDLQNLYYRTEIRNSNESRINLDSFFQNFFRAKFADTENDYEKFEGDYHYEMYRNPKIRDYFGNFENTKILYDRICNEIDFFARLYHRIRTSYDEEYLVYNKLLDQNQQYLLVLSGVSLRDPDEKNKITCIARKFDQMHTIIRLLDAYDSSFQRLIYPINRDIRDSPLVEIEKVFDRELINLLVNKEVIEKDKINSINDLFTFQRFSGMRNSWTNFSKYVLMRIDRYLAYRLDKPSYAAGSLIELEDRFNKTTRKIYGMHLEHIYAFNPKNKLTFSENGVFNEALFNNERNLLGVLLLLKDKQNESINNVVYKDKADAYAQSDFIWNELLVGHIHKVDQQKLPVNWPVETVTPDSSGAFPRDKIQARQSLLFEAVKDVWLNQLAGD